MISTIINKSICKLALIVCVAITFTACNNKDEKEVKIGTILGLTGNNAAYGIKMQRGFDLAKKEIERNKNSIKIKLITEDSQFDPSKAVSAYKKLYSIDGARIIVGITGSKNALAVCEVSKNDDITIIDALGSAPKLSTIGTGNYFRIMASDAFAGKYNVGWAIENKMKKPAIVFIEDDWGTSYCDAVKKYLLNAGISEFRSFGINEGGKDYRTVIEKIKIYNPDTIFLLIYAGQGASFMKQLKQSNMKQPMLYGSDNISSPEFLSAGADVVEGVYVAMPSESRGVNYDKMSKEYRLLYNEDPDANVIKSYDAFMLTYSALQKVGSDPSKLKSYLKSKSFSYDGISGNIKFDVNGDLIQQEYARMVYRNGKLVQFLFESN